MSVETIAAEVKTLTDKDLEKLQLFVNGEVAVRIQEETLRNRLEEAFTEAQAQGYSDKQVDEIMNSSRAKIRRAATVDKDRRPLRAPDPGIIADLRNNKGIK